MSHPYSISRRLANVDQVATALHVANVTPEPSVHKLRCRLGLPGSSAKLQTERSRSTPALIDCGWPRH